MIQTTNKSPTRHLGFRTRVIEHLPAPFERGLWTLVSLDLLLWRHIQPVNRKTTRTFIEAMNLETDMLRLWHENMKQRELSMSDWVRRGCEGHETTP